MSAGKPVYCIDSSALIGGYNRIYPAHVFVKLWDNMSDLVEDGRLVAPEEVLKELEYQRDDLTKWAKARKPMFHRPNYHETAFLSQIATDFKALSKSTVAANTADPFVVAMAKIHGYIVISEEKRGSLKNPKIPQICKHYHVAHVPFLNLILAEGWVFL